MKIDRRFLLRGSCQGALAVMGLPFLDCFLDSKGKALAAGPDRTAEAAERLVRAKRPDAVSFSDWKRLDQMELERGKASGKLREKFNSIPEALAALKPVKA